MKKILRKLNKNEQGVAIVFTLGILGLLTVMALGFASTALMNGKLSQNTTSNAYTKSLAKNYVLNRILATLNSDTFDTNQDLAKLYSYDTSDLKDWLYKLNTKIDGVHIYDYKTSDNVRWQYVKDTDSRLIGRYAYVVIPDRGSLDPNTHLGIDYNSTDTFDYVNPGKYISGSFPNATPFKTALQTAEKDGSGNETGNYLANDFRWASFKEMITKLNLNQDTDTDLPKWFSWGINIVTPYKIPEAYYNENDKKLYKRFNINDETYWSQIQTNFEAAANGQSVVDQLIGKTASFSEFLSDMDEKITFIPTLKNIWTKSDDDAKTRVHQIAANIIQYNLPNTVKTVSDVDPPQWTTTTPTYMGIGRHPMLNEIGLAVKVEADMETSQPDPEQEVTTCNPYYTVTIRAGTELINPFYIPKDKLKNCEVILHGKISISLCNAKAGTYKMSSLGSLWVNFSGSITSNCPFQATETPLTAQLPKDESSKITMTLKVSDDADENDWESDLCYTKGSSFWNIGNDDVSKTGIRLNATAFQIKKSKTYIDENKESILKYMRALEVKFAIEKVMLKYDGKERDFAILNKDLIFEPKTSFWSSVTGTDTKYYFASYQAKDPFVNLQTVDWAVSTFFHNASDSSTIDVKYTTSADSANYGSTNKFVGTSDTGAHKNQNFTGTISDENISDPANVSFAYIRHGVMKGFWEFACIHSGKSNDELGNNQMWRPLNLTKKGKELADYKLAYPSFAEIFDHIKFTDKQYATGLINLNTSNHSLLYPLCQFINGHYRTNINATKTKEIISEAGSIAETPQISTEDSVNPASKNGADSCLPCSIAAAKGTSQEALFKNRSDLLDTSKNGVDKVLTRLSVGNNQTEKAQAVSLLMPFVKTTPADMIYVVVLSQGIKEANAGQLIFVDWDGQGFEPTAIDEEKAKKKAGFTYSYKDSNGATQSGDLTPTGYTFSAQCTKTTKGTYTLGADKITGETKLIAALVRDPVTGKWSIARIQYVE